MSVLADNSGQSITVATAPPVSVGGARTRNIAAVTGVLVVLAALVVTAIVLRDGGSSPTVPNAAADSAAVAPTGGSDFIESNGSYSLRVGEGWKHIDAANGAAWYTGTGSRQFRDNVNVFVEELPSRVSLQRYVELSIANVNRAPLGFVERDRQLVVLSNGTDAMAIDYETMQQGFLLRHRLLITVHDLVAVNVTFTSERDRFANVVADVDAYMRTVNVR